jgi:stage V sporulation protein SpoVS
MRFQEIVAKIVAFFAPDGMDMVCLSAEAAIVEFNEKRGAVDNEVMAF